MEIESVVCDGRAYTYVKRPDAAAVLVLRDGYVLLVQQYRPSVGHWVLELPAGRIEPGEAPSEAARRELREETGYIARLWENLGWFYPSCGYTNEKIHLFKATHLEKGEPELDDGEDIELSWHAVRDLQRMARCGSIYDSKILVALGRLAER